MVRNGLGVMALICALFLCSCSKKDEGSAGTARATVSMRDGTSFNGAVLSSSANEIRLAGSDNVTRTIPLSQVKSIDYANPEPTAPAPGPPPSAPSPDEDARLHEQHYHPDQSAITTKTFELPPGTQIFVRNEETIDSGHAVEGQTFAAEVTRDVRDAAGDCVIPRGANAQIVIRSASKGGHFRGSSDLVMDLASVAINGRRFELSTKDLVERGRQGVGGNRRTGEFAGGGAAIGAIIGAIAGGGKGAAIGAGSGAGAGAVTEILTKGTIKVPVESVLTFRLDAPLQVIQAQ
jgi:hypothetical protein